MRHLLAVALAAWAIACKGNAKATSDASAAPNDGGVVRAAGGGIGDASTVSIVEAGAPLPCVRTALQPDACVPKGIFPLRQEAIPHWLEGHGLRAAEATRTSQGIEGCREASFGPAHESVLLCDEVEVTHVDATLGLDGPAQVRNVLRVMTVRASRLVNLVRVPVSVHSSSDELFRASVAVDDPAGTLDVMASPADCSAAKSRHDAYWDAKLAEMRKTTQDATTRKLTTGAIASERKAGPPRIAAICAAAGHYELRDGKLAKAP